MNHQSAITRPRASHASRPPASKVYQRARLAAAVLTVDLFTLIVSSLLGREVSDGLGYGFTTPLAFATAIIPLYGLSGFALRAFTGWALIQRVASVRSSVFAAASGAGLLLLIMFALQASDSVSRAQLLISITLSLFLLPLARCVFTGYARRSVDGELYSAVYLHDEIDGGPSRRRHFSFDDSLSLLPNDYHRLSEYVGDADRVVIRCAPERRAHWSHIFQGMNVRAEVIAAEFIDSPILAVGEYCGEPTLVVARGPLGLRDRMIKRAFDIAVSVAAILALVPLFILVSIAIKIDSKGPVFFRQPRIGRQNRIFDIYKFRSMRAQEGDVDGTRSATRDDDRITKVGRFIRSTSIDELPQLINVLLGDMSIVGPRPHALYSKARGKLFWEVDHRYWHRHACKPGITGLAQVRGHRGATHQEKDLEDRLHADLEYLNGWSLWLDVGILVRTLGVVVHRNAF